MTSHPAEDEFGISVPEFCRRFGISTPTYYKMRAAGEGPREIRAVGTLVRISASAIADWLRQREDPAVTAPHRAKNQTRSQHATSGGRA